MTHAVRFQHPRYTIRRKFFRFFGDAFHLYTDDGELALYSNMKRFRIREDIRLYADESGPGVAANFHSQHFRFRWRL